MGGVAVFLQGVRSALVQNEHVSATAGITELAEAVQRSLLFMLIPPNLCIPRVL